MRSRVIRLIVSVFALSVAIAMLHVPQLAYAHPERAEHNKELERMLFDNESFSKDHRSDSQGATIADLETAAYLCIDQFGSSGAKDLEDLRSRVAGLPESVTDINPTTYNLSPKTHRAYSHRGWETINYQNKENRERFEIRRSILLNTVNEEFDFGFAFWLRTTKTYTDKCDSFCALVYYMHVLGDYIEDGADVNKLKESNVTKIAFARQHPSDKNPDIFWELDKHLAILFRDQAESRTYKQLMTDLHDLANRSRKLAGTTGGINTDEKCETAAEYVKELMAMLSGGYGGYQYANRVHMMLVNEDFFSKTFPSA